MTATMRADLEPRGLFEPEYGHFIGGQWLSSRSGRRIDVTSPATGRSLAYIQQGSSEDVQLAVAAASEAFRGWSVSSLEQRRDLLLELGRRLEARKSDFAMMETLDNGKPISESLQFDLPAAIENFYFFAGSLTALRGETIVQPDSTTMIYREPLGVCAQIIPWNVPLVMMAAKIAPALAAGNTVVLKPSEVCCLSVLEFFREVSDVLPPGVVNVVTGYGDEVGEPLVSHPAVRKVALTGSRDTARKVMDYARVNLIPQTFELGGKSASIICEDADIEAAAEGVVASTIFNKGEVCLAASRVFVHETLHDEFLERVAQKLKSIRIGDPTDTRTQLGPQASKAQYERVCRYLELGLSEGANAYTGGAAAEVAGFPHGFFIQPTLFSGVENTMKIAQDEIFGPVSCVIPWKNEEDVVRQVNATRYGLAGGIWSRNVSRVQRLSRGLEAGVIWVNRYYNFISGMPVGGYKESGFGREGCLQTLDHYSQLKTVVIDLDERAKGHFS